MNNENLVFDQYQRYATIARLIEYHRHKDNAKRFKILELGSNTYKNLSQFLTQDEILFSDTQLDETMKKDPEFVQVDGTNIQFSDDSFDFVVAADVLEHVPFNKRSDFILEACRVAKIGVVICFPSNEPYVREAEARINAYYKAVEGEDYIWLKEHLDNGLPDKKELESFLNANRLKYFSCSHGTINLWEKMWYCHFNACFTPESLNYKSLIDNYYNRKLYQQDVGEECYRSFYVIAHCDFDLWQEYSQKLWRQFERKDVEFLDELLRAQRSIHSLSARTEERKVAEQRAKELNEAYSTESELRKAAEKRIMELNEAYLAEAKLREAVEKHAAELNEAYLAEAAQRETVEKRAVELNEAHLAETARRETVEKRAVELNEAYLTEAARRETVEKRAAELNEAYLAEAARRETVEKRAAELNEAYLAEAARRETAEKRAEELEESSLRERFMKLIKRQRD